MNLQPTFKVVNGIKVRVFFGGIAGNALAFVE
jgi:hypothetical protein